jgi:hypothetical protein
MPHCLLAPVKLRSYLRRGYCAAAGTVASYWARLVGHDGPTRARRSVSETATVLRLGIRQTRMRKNPKGIPNRNANVSVRPGTFRVVRVG